MSLGLIRAIPLGEVGPQIHRLSGHAIQPESVEKPGEMIGDALPLDEDRQERPTSGVDEAALLEKPCVHVVEEKAPLRKNVTQEDVANTALFLCSALGAGVTGEVLHVDSGYNILGL